MDDDQAHCFGSGVLHGVEMGGAWLCAAFCYCYVGILHGMHASGALSVCTLPLTLLVCYAAAVLQVCSAHAAAG
jgi:hypothetical protein